MTASNFSLGAAQKQVPITEIDTDATGNVVTGAPAAVFSSSDTTVLTLAAQADGSQIAARVSAAAGTATISATVTNADGTSATGTLVVSVAAATGIGGGPANVTDVELVPGIAS